MAYVVWLSFPPPPTTNILVRLVVAIQNWAEIVEVHGLKLNIFRVCNDCLYLVLLPLSKNQCNRAYMVEAQRNLHYHFHTQAIGLLGWM